MNASDNNVNPDSVTLTYSNNSIKDEALRYRRKGFGLVIALIIALLYLFIFPELLKKIYPTKITNEGAFQYWTMICIGWFGYTFFNFIMYIIYHLEWPFFEKYKVTKNPWPWNDKNEDWPGTLKKTLITLFINHFICTPVISLEALIKNKPNYRISPDTFPSTFEIAWQIVLFMVCDDFCFYWSHRFLHWDKIYVALHKKHHQYIHTIGLSASYSTPIDFISGVLSAFLCPLILGKRAHLITLWMWTLLRIAETTDGHCGYEFSWSPFRLIPFSGSAEFHDHHHSGFKGNYSSMFTIWDRICGTVNQTYIEYIENKRIELDEDSNKSK